MDNARKGHRSWWSWSTGERGVSRVRVYEHGKAGRLYLEHYEDDPLTGLRKAKRESLGHSDRRRARGEAEARSAELRAGILRSGPVTLGYLITEWLTNVSRDHAPSTQSHDCSATELFLRAFGATFDPRNFSKREWDHFIRERRAGTLRPTGRTAPGPVRDRVVQYDLKVLLAVLTYATHASDGRGGKLLARNPLASLLAERAIKMPKEREPNRPQLSEAEYQALIQRAAEIHPHLKLALEVCHETGHRIGSVHRLRWEDIDLEADVITWPATRDKQRYRHEGPISAALHNTLLIEREAAGGREWVFAKPDRVEEHWCREQFYDWLRQAEDLAGVVHVRGRGFHAFRRKFANDLTRQGTQPSVIAKAGGWKGTKALEECYIAPSIEDARAALARRRPVGIEA